MKGFTRLRPVIAGLALVALAAIVASPSYAGWKPIPTIKFQSVVTSNITTGVTSDTATFTRGEIAGGAGASDTSAAIPTFGWGPALPQNALTAGDTTVVAIFTLSGIGSADSGDSIHVSVQGAMGDSWVPLSWTLESLPGSVYIDADAFGGSGTNYSGAVLEAAGSATASDEYIFALSAVTKDNTAGGASEGISLVRSAPQMSHFLQFDAIRIIVSGTDLVGTYKLTGKYWDTSDD